MVKCSGTDHSIALEVQTFKHRSLLVSSALGKTFYLQSCKDKYCSGAWLTHPKAEGAPSPGLPRFPSYHCPNCVGNELLLSLLGTSAPAGKAVAAKADDEVGFGRYGGIHVFCKQRMSGQHFGKGARARQALGNHWRAICYLVHL